MPKQKANSPVPEFKWIENVTHLMDGVFRVPGTKIRFGLDPLLGLVPGLGEYVGFVVSGILVVAMVRHGVSGRVAAIMVGNILLDYVVGNIPVLGDLFDFAYKANDRNYRLLQKHYDEGRHKGSAWPVVIGVVVFLTLFLIAGLYLVWELLSLLLGWVDG